MSNRDSERYKPTYRPVVLKNERDGFFVHLIIYIIVNIFLATLNLTSDPDVIWFVYPLIGWGIGIIAHFVFAIVLAKKSYIHQNEAKSEKLGSEDSSNKGKNDEVKSE
ncbi:MAG TPA: 2TM domain-containing protein [Nitrososphaeraceae archaeon]|jgi:phosphotransferase system  glucose/maltose/N-acetylglucosamine-specific IIC component|nr:2TM domain-containing protein [Nitrososphaeraceae archaeon]